MPDDIVNKRLEIKRKESMYFLKGIQEDNGNYFNDIIFAMWSGVVFVWNVSYGRRAEISCW